MALVIELPPSLEELLREEASRHGQNPHTYVLQVLTQQLTDAQRDRGERVRPLMEEWNAEDVAGPDSDPPPVIPRLSLREVSVD